MKELFVDVLLVSGIGCLAYGAHQIHPAAAWIVAGLALTIAGVIGVVAIADQRANFSKEKKRP